MIHVAWTFCIKNANMARKHKSSPVARNYIARVAVFIPSLLVSTSIIHCE